MRFSKIVGALALWELFWWGRRVLLRNSAFAAARARADALRRPLVVVGAPDSGPTRGPGCGDVTIDIADSSCPNFLRADITKPLPFASNSVVVFVSCTLEYVDDYPAALAEIQRISGGEFYVTRVEPWTLVAHGVGYAPVKQILPATLGKSISGRSVALGGCGPARGCVKVRR